MRIRCFYDMTSFCRAGKLVITCSSQWGFCLLAATCKLLRLCSIGDNSQHFATFWSPFFIFSFSLSTQNDAWISLVWSSFPGACKQILVLTIILPGNTCTGSSRRKGHSVTRIGIPLTLQRLNPSKARRFCEDSLV